MVDFDYCDHECACQHNGHLEAAQQYSSLLSKVMNKNADSEPVSKEDKDKWDNKANQDVVDLIKMMVEKHEEKLDELEEGLDKKVKLILYNLGFGDNVLAKYATIEYVNELVAKIKNETSDLSKYALKTDLDTIKNDIQNKINNLTTEINNIKVTGGKDYSIESFNYTPSNGQLVLKQKNGGEFTVSIVAGGIDTSKLVTKEQLTNELTKYAEINKLKKIKVDGNVHTLYNTDGEDVIEIKSGGTPGPDTGKDGGRYQAYFKCVDKSITKVDAPTAGAAPESGSGWTEYSINRGPNQNVWMTQVFVNSDGDYGQYITPICITGADGSAGADQADRDFIYKRTIKNENPGTPEGENKDGWTDNPQGVGYDENTRTLWISEWVSVRSKVDGEWTAWSPAVLWSHYGSNGTDGDGVEYIFAVSQTKQAPINDNPHDWYDNATSKANGKDEKGTCSWEGSEDEKKGPYFNHKYYNADEYIKQGSIWTDDPQEIPSGGTAWVSVRKKRNDTNSGSAETKDAYWHQYSAPTLWAYHAKDGVADAVVADASSEIKYLQLDEQGKNKYFEGDSVLSMYNNGALISFQTQVGLTCSDATQTVTGYNDWFTTEEGPESKQKTMKMKIPAGKLNMSDGKYWILRVGLRPQDTGVAASGLRYVDILLYGITNASGDDAVSYKLDTTASAINYQDNAFYPKKIGFFITKSEGKTVTQIRPSDTSDWTFSYSTDGGTNWGTTKDNEVDVSGEDGMYFRAQNGDLDFREYVPIVKSGIEGLNGVSYKIDVSGMSLNYKESTENKGKYDISSTFTIKLYKKEGNKDYAIQKTSGYECNVTTNPTTETNPTKNTDGESWNCTLSGKDLSSSSAIIQIVINNNNEAFVDSAVIPISAAGKDGDASTGQTLQGSPLRIRGSFEPGATYYDGKRAAEGGIFYQDIVLYNNMYYACINYETWQTDKNNIDKNNPAKSDAFQPFTINNNTFCDLLAANKAYIKEISSNEIVIFDDNNKIVAGMTSGKAVDEKSDLYDKVDKNGKGNVRIWAGDISNKDLTTAPFTVTDAGVLKSTNANITGQINATSGKIGNFNISDGSLITGESKLEIGTESGSESSSGRPYRRKVTIDAQGNELSNYNYMLCVESSRLESTANAGTTAGVYIDVDGNNNRYQYCGINMPRGQFWGLRCATRHTTTNIDFRNIADWKTFVSGMTIICTGSSEITITLPNKDFAKEGDEFTVLKGNDDYESQQVSLSYTAGHAVGRLAVEGMGARIIFANGKWRICHYN